MNKEDILESGILEQFVLGLTDDRENEMVYQAIQEFPELQDYLDKIEKTMEAIAHQHSINPPAEVREKTFNKILQSEKLKLRSAKSRTISEVLGAVLALVLLGCTIYYYNSNNDNIKEIQKNRDEINNLKSACEDSARELEYKTNLLALYEDEHYKTFHLTKSDQNTPEKIVVFWDDRGEKAFLHNMSLIPPPTGKTYQIWADVDQKMIPLGIFGEAEKLIEIRCLKNASSLNVTIEPEGGSEHPDVSNLIMSIGV